MHRFHHGQIELESVVRRFATKVRFRCAYWLSSSISAEKEKQPSCCDAIDNEFISESIRGFVSVRERFLLNEVE